MIKNKLIIFMILIFALVSIGVASAEDSSSLNTTDIEVSDDLDSVDVVTSESDDDSLQLQSDEVKSSNLNNEEDNDMVGLSSSQDNELNESQTNNKDVLEYEGDVVLGQSITPTPTLGKSYNVGGSTFADIQNAIDKASAGDTLFLGGKTFTGSGTQITINKNINIYGGSSTTDTKMATLDGKSLSTIVHIKDNVIFKNIIFKTQKGMQI